MAIGVFSAHVLPLVRFFIVGVPGPTIVHTGQACVLPLLIIVMFAPIEVPASATGNRGRIPVALGTVNRAWFGVESCQYGSSAWSVNENTL